MFDLHQKMRRFRRKHGEEINPEDIFIDSANLPGLDRDRMEGRLEKPIGERTFLMLKILFVCVGLILAGKLSKLQIVKGQAYAAVSTENRLDRKIIFADRGVILDRNGEVLAGNAVRGTTTTPFAERQYLNEPGLAAILGYVKYPAQDSQGYFYDESYHGQAGVEKSYDSVLSGTNGSQLTEYDAKGNLISEATAVPPVKGKDITLGLDWRLSNKLYTSIESLAHDKGFQGGAAVMMDVRTGEIVALTSYPEYDPNLLADASDHEAIAKLLLDPTKPFLDRAVSGLYTPGSIVKPIVALGALTEGVIDPLKKIISTGSISLPNPYDPTHPSVFRDWRAQGAIDMRQAIAVSSDVYFYEVGGGFGNQKGLGITNLDKYFSLFGFNTETGVDLPAESEGYIATPDWKAKNFPDDPDWRIGDTYHTAIGQYGTQVTPMEAVRWVAAIANGGTLLKPSVLLGGSGDPGQKVDLPAENFQIVREGMYQGVHGGVASGLSTPEVAIAAKTGTAELGVSKANVNSWVTGFFPYENPKYAFAVVLEHGPVTNTVGGVFIMRQLIDWMAQNTPQYLSN